jgi:Fe-Mn family superoxide dismutase
MEIHHGKHHNAYVTNLNKAVGGTPIGGQDHRCINERAGHEHAAVRNNGGGHYNHSACSGSDVAQWWWHA